MSAPAMAGNVTNAEFLGAVFGAVKADERMWVTMFSTPPNSARGEWRGSDAKTSEDVPDADRVNAYFSVAALRVIAGSVNRDKTHFGRLCSVVTDDSPVDDGASWVLETSEGNFQNGYILANDITDCGVAERLHKELARAKAVKADTSGNNPVRYVRLPVGTNTKCNPPFANQLRVWQPELVFALEDVCERLGLDIGYITNGQQQAESPRDHDRGSADRADHRLSDGELIRQITTTENYHDPLLKLTARYRLRGIRESDVVETVRGVMESNSDRSERWQSRYNDIPRIVAGAFAKYGIDEMVWGEPSDLWSTPDAPVLPAGIIPAEIENYAMSASKVGGFDFGGCASAMLAVCAAAITDEVKIHASRNDRRWLESARVWLALVGDPSAKKTPVLQKAYEPLIGIAADLDKENASDEAAFRLEVAQWKAKPSADRGEEPQPKPHRRLMTTDASNESMGEILRDNPRGILVRTNELSAWIGGSGAYSATAAGGIKALNERLELYDGGRNDIDRIGRGHLVVENWSACIIGGSQPDQLQKLFAKMPANGMIERFIWANVRSAPEIDGEVDEASVDVYHQLVRKLFRMEGSSGSDHTVVKGAQDGAERIVMIPGAVSYSDEAEAVRKRAVAVYERQVRELAAAHPGLASHIGKFRGLFSRLALVFHCIEQTKSAEPSNRYPAMAQVSVESAIRAERYINEYVMPSAAVFHKEVIGHEKTPTTELLQKLAERILALGLTEITPTVCSKHMARWRFQEPRTIENCLRLLCEAGWLAYMQPERVGRTRAPDWRYLVNPRVVARFAARGDGVRQADSAFKKLFKK